MVTAEPGAKAHVGSIVAVRPMLMEALTEQVVPTVVGGGGYPDDAALAAA
jgi:hypothetical protein